MVKPAAVNATWLSKHLEDPDVVLVDVRPPFFFGQAHLPGAVNLPASILVTPSGNPPAAAPLAAKLGELGVSRESHVVAYDDGASYAAAQVYWMLKYYRHAAASVLDGGITAWRHDGYDWEYDAVAPVPTVYEIGERDASVLAEVDEVLQSLSDPNSIIVDVRSPAEYLGLQPTAPRNGHMPGAVNIDWSNNFVRDDNGIVRLRPDDELRGLYTTSGVTPDKRVIVMCSSGGRSSETFMVLRKLGFEDVANYAGGWQEWNSRADTPVVTE
jgi:thiosulfate/3-mercaptopyruvate sulfurtransferase